MNLIKGDGPTEFSTERLVMKRCAPSFAPALFEAATESIPEAYPFLPWCHPDYSLSDAEVWLSFGAKQWGAKQAYSFSIFDRDSLRLLGGCGLHKFDEHPVANLGYWVRTSAVGAGIATEATVGLAKFAFELLGFRRLEIIMSTRNLGSRQVAINSKATFEATLRNRLELHGELHDAHLYSLTTAPDDEYCSIV